MRSKGSASALEEIRRRAVACVLAGQTQTAVAQAFGLHLTTVAKWVARHRAEGSAGLAATLTPGRPRLLCDDQEATVRSWLTQKPTEHGFRTNLWTAACVAELIDRNFGVRFHPNYLREWLSTRGYSPQRPAKRARQRNDETIAGWVKADWPRIKKAGQTHAHIVLIDETGLFLQPVVRRTWALIGQTPTLVADGQHRWKVSVIGGLSVSPNVQRLGFYIATEPDGFFTVEKVIAYLRDLLRHLRGPVIVVWDCGSNHEGPLLRAFLARTPRLHLERLPPWAPDHYPAEAVWSWLKWGVLANYAPEDIDRLDDAIVERLVEKKHNGKLLKSLWNRSELPFPKKC